MSGPETSEPETREPHEVVHSDATDLPKKLSPAARIGVLTAVLGGLAAVGHFTGLTAILTQERVRDFMTELGPIGFVLFCALFAVGELVHVPGFVFVGAAVLAYGAWVGGAAAFVGALASVTLSFFVVRSMGGKALGALKWSFARRMLAHLDERPVRTVVMLRSVLWLAPALNYVLAMSNIRFRDYLIGSALGLALPVTGMAIAFGYALD